MGEFVWNISIFSGDYRSNRIYSLSLSLLITGCSVGLIGFEIFFWFQIWYHVSGKFDTLTFILFLCMAFHRLKLIYLNFETFGFTRWTGSDFPGLNRTTALRLIFLEQIAHYHNHFKITLLIYLFIYLFLCLPPIISSTLRT